MGSNSKRVMVTTPIGKASWFSLQQVDKFGNYTCSLELEDSPATHKLISKIDSMGEGRRPYKKNDDGSYILKLKIKSQGQKKDGSTYMISPPVVYDALGKKIEGAALEKLNVGNGSEIRAKLELSTYDFNGLGVSAKPKAVQISKLVEFQGSDADLGFDALEIEQEDLGESSGDDYDF